MKKDSKKIFLSNTRMVLTVFGIILYYAWSRSLPYIIRKYLV